MTRPQPARKLDPITAALATSPTARGRWVRLPVDTDEGERPPTLHDGDEYTVITPDGDVLELTWTVTRSRGSHFADESGDGVDVVAVWIPSRSGPNVPEDQRRSEAVKLRLQPGSKERLRDIARANGLTISAQVEAWIDAADGR